MGTEPTRFYRYQNNSMILNGIRVKTGGAGRSLQESLPALPFLVAVSFDTGGGGLVEKALFKLFMRITGPVTAVSPHDLVLYNREQAKPAKQFLPE
jgi:hypothetical protein